MAKKSRHVGLDILKIFLASLTLAFHSVCHFGCSYGVINGFVSMGAIAMTGFFVLSGFLNYDVNGAKDFSELKEIRKFWLKRLISIFPAYYFGALLYIITWGKESLIQNIILAPIELLAIQNIFPNMFGITHNGGTWFISCILICHFIFPYLSSIIKQLNVKMRIISIGILVLVLLYAPLITYFFDLGSIYDNPFMRGVSLQSECCLPR